MARSRSPYGADELQFGELSRPAGSAHAGTVVIIHADSGEPDTASSWAGR